MDIAVIGAGNVGKALSGAFVRAGNKVTISSAHPETAREAAEGTGATAVDSNRAAAAAGDVVVLAVPYPTLPVILDDLGDALRGKVVIDATNPLDFSGGFPPKLSIAGADSLGERVQGAVPDARVVKAFNTIGAPHFVDPTFSEGRPTMLIAGDDADAKRTVGDVLADFGWPDPVDIGGIEGSRELEAIGVAWIKIGGMRGAWDHAFALLVG